jgi:hypothetical protein
MPPGHDCRARWRALRLDVAVVEADALVCQLVDTRRGYRTSVHTEISPADVVHQNEHDIGLIVLRHFALPEMTSALLI